MRPLIPLLFATLVAAASAQTPPPAATATPQLLQHPQTQTLQTGAQLVIVDVVVQDNHGNPVHGLKREDFSVTEDKTGQAIRNFEEHTREAPGAAPPPEVKLPPGTFTNYTPVPPHGALNILLLDTLNTPMQDQSYVRYQLQKFVAKSDPGTRIAIFGLNTRLTILQGFTAQPSVLKDAVEHKLLPRASTLLDDPVSGDSNMESMSDSLSDMGASAQTVANLQQFEAQEQSFQLQLRMQYTLDAFNTLAHYLSALPGRKNLIWFSGSFPLDILPDGTLDDPFAVMASSDEEFRETTNLLTQAQVAVYPIDARGLMTQPVFSASNSGHGFSRNPSAFNNKINGFFQSQAAEHSTMELMAEDTGGHAYYNTNGLTEAVTNAINSGSNYYTLAYAPVDRKQDGGYRNIRVTLNGALAARSLKLAYRRGYFADEARKPHQATAVTLVSDPAEQARRTARTYAQAAMARGTPEPQDILFKVRVLPASKATETTMAPGNQADPITPMKGPYRRFDVDFAALPRSFTLTSQPDGNRTGSIEFTVYVYDSDGKLLNADGNTVNLNLPPDTYAKFMQGAVGAHLEVSAPAKSDSYLRIAIHDIPSNRFGVVEIPALSVSRLDPPVYPPAAVPPATPAATPRTPATAPASTPAAPPAH